MSTLESHVDRTEYGPVALDVLWHQPGHPKWYGYNFNRESGRHLYDRPASASTPKLFGAYLYPTRYAFCSVRRTSKTAAFIQHGTTECLKVSGPLSLRDATGGDSLFTKGLDIDHNPVVPNHLVAAADARCLEGIQINLAENLATFKQTIEMMGGLAEAGFELLTEFAKLKKAIRDPKKIAKLWLQYQYGFKPLIADIVKLQQFDLKPAGFATSRGQASEPFDRVVPNLLPVGYEVLTFSDGSRLGCNTQIAYICDDPNLAALNSLGLTNPALLFWELTPFSFIADWFWNVGTIISCISTGVGLRFLFGSRTRWLRKNYGISWKPVGSDVEGTPYGEEGRGLAFTREVLDSFPVPPFVWSPNIDLTKLLNAMALYAKFR